MTPKLEQPSAYFRSDVLRGATRQARVDREHGILRDHSVMTAGEALGHNLWIDATMLGQTVDAINAAPAGIKSRFTHPSLSGDGLGTFLGRVKNARLVGDQVRADLHFAQSAHETPDGDLAGYVMKLAEEDPEALGASISYKGNLDAEEEFRAANLDEQGRFRSPDPNNKKNLRHARIAILRASDLVDSPAANPNGLFHRGDEIAADADAAMAYALGISDENPSETMFGVEGSRLRAYAQRFFNQHGLELVPTKEPAMAKTQNAPAGPVQNENPPVAPETSAAAADPVSGDDLLHSGRQAELDRFAALQKRFSSDPAFVNKCFADGLSADQAESLWKDQQIKALSERVSGLEKKLTALNHGAAPLEFSGEGDGQPADFMALARARATEKKITLSQAMSSLAREQPELYAAHKARIQPVARPR